MTKKLFIIFIVGISMIFSQLLANSYMHNVYEEFAKFRNICNFSADYLINKQCSIPRCGVISRFSDLEMVTLGMVSENVVIHSKSIFFVKPIEYQSEIPHLISRRQYNDRRKFKTSFCTAIREKMSETIYSGKDYFCIDSEPIEICRFIRAKQCSMVKNEIEKSQSFGFCSSQRAYYYAYKLYAVCGLRGFVHFLDLTKASVHDIYYMKDTKVDYSDYTVIGDRGYISADV